MCALAGLAGTGDDPSRRFRVPAMLHAMRARGPDGDGLLEDDDVVLGHVRLSIQGHGHEADQPMVTPDGRHALAFNGEVYNWRPLRASLEARYPFRTERSDTEVLLAGLATEGEAFLDRVEGMYALALVDRREGRLLLARDGVGEKPLYYARADGEVVFASEAVGVAAGLRERPGVDADGLYHYLTMLSAPSGASLLRGIAKVAPGEMIEIGLQDHAVRRRVGWTPLRALRFHAPATPSEVADTSGPALRRSVERQALSDTPLSVALSGGLDSSLNLVLAHAARSGEAGGGSTALTALNVTFEDAPEASDESRTARRLAAEHGVAMVPLVMDEGAFWSAFDAISEKATDTPVVWPDQVLLHAMTRTLRAKTDARVLLVGEGGDELGAYPSYMTALDEFERATAPGADPDMKLAHLLRHEDGLLPRRLCFGLYEANKRQCWLGPPPARDTEAVFAEMIGQVPLTGPWDAGEGFARRILALEYGLRLPELLLARLDTASMANGIECRAPFLGRALIEETLRTPFAARNAGRPKAWMYEVARDLLPAHVTERPKQGFGGEFGAVVGASVKTRFEREVLGDPAAPLFGYLDRAWIARYFERLKPAGVPGSRVFILYALNRWLTRWA